MNLKRICAVVLTIVFSLTVLTACGTGPVNTAANEEQMMEEKAIPEMTDTVTKAYYEVQYVEIQDHELTATLENGIAMGDMLYYSSLGVIGDNTPDGVVPEWPEQYWIYGPIVCKVMPDGAVERIPYSPAAPETENTGNSGILFEALCADENETLWIVEKHYRNWNDTSDEIPEDNSESYGFSHTEEHYFLTHIREDGSVIASHQIDGLKNHEQETVGTEGSYDFEVRGMATGSNNQLYLAIHEWFSGTSTYVEDNRICILNSGTGELTESLSISGAPEYIAPFEDGRIAICRFERGSEQIGVINPETKTIEDAASIDDFVNGMTAGSGSSDLYYSAGDSFYRLNLETGDSVKLFNWIDCDVAFQGTESICIMLDGRIITTTGKQTSDGMDNKLIVLTPSAENSMKDKKVLHLAVSNLYPFTSEMVSQFNRSNPDYRIEVTDYAQYNDYSTGNEEDWNAGITRLQTEIIAGNIPDILDMSLLSADRLGSKGILEDLYPYIDADPEFNRNDLMEHIIEAFEEDGKLYQTVGNFYVLTTAGLSSVVGDRMGWTMDEFNTAMQTLLAENPHSTAFDSYTTREDVLNFLLYLDLDNYVDWNSGECKFDTDTFIQFLNFVKSFPTSFDWTNADMSAENLDQDTRLLMGLQLMKQCNFVCFEDLKTNTDGLGDAACTFVGYPTENGVGSMFAQIGNSFAITSSCTDKEAAWQFVRQFFLPVYQEQFIGSVFPTNLSVYEKMKLEAMTPQYQRNPDGSYVLNANGSRVAVDRGSIQANGEVVSYQAMTEEEITKVEEIIEATENILHVDRSLKEIISEGAAPFFADQRSVEEVAKLIQSKAALYVNEQR